jgi:glycosyltransferase involved in cell wall biosynthesis
MVSYLSFATVASMLAAPLVAHSDVALVYSTPATAALPALLARRMAGVPFVLYIADLWPDTVLESGMVRYGVVNRAVGRILTWFCDHVYRAAARITVPSDGMRQILIQRGVPIEKISVLHHWVDESLFRPVAPSKSLRTSLDLEDRFVAMYAGSLGDLQGLEVAVRAAALLQDLPDFSIVLLGTGVAEQRLRRLVSELGLTNVVFAGARPPGEMPALMHAADVQLVTLRDIPFFHANIPSKVQAILATGCPVVSSAPGDTGTLVAKSGGGIACPAEDPAALADALRRLHAMTAAEREELGRAGRSFYESHLSESIGAKRLANLLQEAAQ